MAVLYQGTEFYRLENLLNSRMRAKMRQVGILHENIVIENRPPVIIGNETAASWLFANCAFATDFAPNRPIGVGEVSGYFNDSKTGQDMITPDKCFSDIQWAFSGLREIEDEYAVFAERLAKAERRTRKTAVEAYIPTEARVGDFIRAMTRRWSHAVRRYGNADCIPALEDGLWKIRATSIRTIKETPGTNGLTYKSSIHSHPGRSHWSDSMLSSNDFYYMIALGEPNLGESESYTMHIPHGALGKIRRLLGENHRAGMKEKVQRMQRERDFLDVPMETDLLGLRFVWDPQRGRFYVSPVLSEIHYNSVKGKVPEGVDLKTTGFYIARKKEDLVPFNLVRYQP